MLLEELKFCAAIPKRAHQSLNNGIRLRIQLLLMFWFVALGGSLRSYEGRWLRRWEVREMESRFACSLCARVAFLYFGFLPRPKDVLVRWSNMCWIWVYLQNQVTWSIKLIGCVVTHTNKCFFLLTILSYFFYLCTLSDICTLCLCRNPALGFTMLLLEREGSRSCCSYTDSLSSGRSK